MARKSKSSAMAPMQMIKYGVFGAVGLGFVSLIWVAATNQDEISSRDMDLPLVGAPEAAVKKRATEAGGMNIPNQDKQVFDLLEGTQKPVKPQQAPQVAEVKEFDLPPVDSPKIKDSASIADIVAEVEKAPTQKPAPIVQPKTEVKKVVKKVETPKPTPTVKGDWGVQLASFLSAADAKKAALSYQSKYKKLLSGHPIDIQKADLGSKGVRYRVRFVGIDSKSAAQSLCNSLKQLNQGCLYVKTN